MPISREQLYEECWAEPMTKVASRHGVSSSFLARVCERMNVPRPPRGYWAQLAVGKASAKPSLPEARPEDEIEWVREGEHRTVAWAPPIAPTKTRPSRNREAKRFSASLHPLVAGARPHFANVRPSDNGYLRPFKRLLVDLYVSKASLDSALSFANELFLEFERLEHPVTIARHHQQFQRPILDERVEPGKDRYYPNTWSPDRPTIATVGSLAIGLTVFEQSELVEAKYSDGVYLRVNNESRPASRRSIPSSPWVSKHDMPSGRLCLRATSPYPVAIWERLWHESKPGDLQGKVKKIVREISSDAPQIAELVRDGEIKAEADRAEWEARWQKHKIEEELRQKAERKKASLAALLSIVDSWARAKDVDAFFEDVRNRTTFLSEPEREAIAHRASQARALLGGIDALEKLLQWTAPDELVEES